MATTFPLDLYPLDTKTKFKPNLGTKLDRLSDGTVRSRVTTTERPITIQCVFSPQSAADSEAFLEYLYTNTAMQFDLPHNGVTYRGYIDGETLDNSPSSGILHWWTFVFEGNAL